MARRRKSNQSNDIVKYSLIGVAVLAALMLIINFAPTGQFYNMQTYKAYGYNAFEELPETFALSTFAPGTDMLLSPTPSDHDKDGVSDEKECPNLFLDTDGDTIPDLVETLQTGTDPNNADTDGDGILDNMDSYPLDETLPIPPTVGPGEPGPGTEPGDGLDDGDSFPGTGDKLGPGQGGQKPGFSSGISGALAAIGITGAGFHEQGLGNIEIILKPTSTFTYDPVSPTVDEVVTFDGSMSNTDLMKEICSNPNHNGDQAKCESLGECISKETDRDGFPIIAGDTKEDSCDGTWTGYTWSKPTIAEYNWDFGDAMGTGMSTTHTYSSEGNFDVTLTIITSNGIKGTSTQTLTVGPKAATPPPVATGIGAIVSDPAAEGVQVLDWITDKTLAGNFRNCPDNPNDITKGNGIPDIIDRGSDYDGDGWTDFYASQNGGVNGEGLDFPPESDTDGDGFNDKEEGTAGSDFADRTSVPAGQGEGETSLIIRDSTANNQCNLLIRPAETRDALAILKVTDAGTVTGFVYQTRALEAGVAQTLTIDKPSAGDLCEGFLWEDWSGTPMATKVEIAI